jgi:hypothetical protein
MSWSNNPMSSYPTFDGSTQTGEPKEIPTRAGWIINNMSEVPTFTDDTNPPIPIPQNPALSTSGMGGATTPYFLQNQIRRYNGAYGSNFAPPIGGYYHSGMYRIGLYMQPWAGSEGLWNYWQAMNYEPRKGRVLINENSTQGVLSMRQWLTNRRSSPAPIALQQYQVDPRQLMPGNYRAVYP